jgi:hypothetical protein
MRHMFENCVVDDSIQAPPGETTLQVCCIAHHEFDAIAMCQAPLLRDANGIAGNIKRGYVSTAFCHGQGGRTRPTTYLEDVSA